MPVLRARRAPASAHRPAGARTTTPHMHHPTLHDSPQVHTSRTSALESTVAVSLLLGCLTIGALAVVHNQVSTVTWITVVGASVAFIILISEIVLHRQRVRAKTADLPVPPLSSWPDVVGAQAFLRRTFNQPTLSIAQWEPRRHCFLTHTGHPLTTSSVVVSYGSPPPPRRAHPTPIFHLTPPLMQSIQTALAEGQRLRDHLHDGTQHHLVSLCIHLRLLEERLTTTGDMPTADALAHMRTTLDKCVGELSSFSALSTDSTAEQQICVDTVRALTTHSPVPVQWAASPDACTAINEAGYDVASTVYFTVAECLTNAWKHSAATSITVTLRLCATGELVGEVSNDGCDPNEREFRAGSGITGMTERLARLGGALRVDRHAACTTVTFTLPVSSQEFEQQ